MLRDTDADRPSLGKRLVLEDMLQVQERLRKKRHLSQKAEDCSDMPHWQVNAWPSMDFLPTHAEYYGC